MTSLLGELLEGKELSERETEILAGAAEGETAAETGRRLHISSETVRGYRKRIIAKLGARNGTHAVALAFRSGLFRAQAQAGFDARAASTKSRGPSTRIHAGRAS